MFDLAEAWINTWQQLQLSPSPSLYDELCQSYAEPQRHYHNLQHLRECLSLCLEDAALAQQPAEIALALWFHDAIYQVGRSDNEAASAAWAQTSLIAAGATTALIQSIGDLIMATQHRIVPKSADAQLLVDIDLSILGAAPSRFAEYERQIRAEYQHIPSCIFNYKRRELLQSFLQREWIYNTPSYRQRYETIARNNLSRAIKTAT